MLRYDVVGCGAMTSETHAPILNRLRREGLLVVGACIDTSLDRAARLSKRLHATAAATINEAGVLGADVALIATPPEFHAELALPYLSAGRSILVEKPFVLTPGDAEKLLRAAEANNARVLVGHMRRMYPAIQVAREVVCSGLLGRIHAAEAREGSRWSWPARSPYMVRSFCGGVLYDTGSHVLDTLLFLLGLDAAETALTVTIDSVVRDRPAEPSHDFGARFRLHREESEIRVDFRVSRTEALPTSLVLQGERASLVVASTFSQQPTLIAGGRPMRLDLPLGSPRPADFTSCIRLEHEALASPFRRPEVAALLDGSRFVKLTQLLDTLAQG